ncbi:MAG: plasmid mobilization relaxosome protein MobC [Defluviitaleaceae bacterium]|nr:plasmid mobilization relaxosome protein MobC [Defluviitaleaceae bacterium]
MSEKNLQIFFDATKAEHEQIKRRAKSVGLPVSTFVREFALNGYVVQRNVVELQRLVWEVNKIGVNINQIVKLCNESKFVSAQSLAKLEEEHHKIWGVIIWGFESR